MPEYQGQTEPNTEDLKRSQTPSSSPKMLTASGPRALLLWSRQQTEGYKDVNIYNMTTSWRDGLAFCAIIHRYRPDLIDFEKLSKDNIVENNTLAFSICDRHFEIPALLDVADMVECPTPDKLSVISYVSQLFNYFKDKTPANQNVSTKMSVVPNKSKPEPVVSGKPNKRMSPSYQIYALSGRAKKFSSALKSVFRSDKEDPQAKNARLQASQESLLRPLPEISAPIRTEDLITPVIEYMPPLGTACFACGDRVYIMERLVAERRLFHRACFRCCRCQSGLRAGTYTFFPESETFCCLYECMGVPKNKQDDVKIQLQPITDNALRMAEVLNLRAAAEDSYSMSSTTGSRHGEGSIDSPHKQFSVVKKNAISIGSLPLTSFNDITPRPGRRQGRQTGRRSGGRRGERSRQGNNREGETRRKIIGPDGNLQTRVSPSSRTKTEDPTSARTNDEEGASTIRRGSNSSSSSGHRTPKKIVGLNDAYNREVEELPQQGGVQALLSKFKNIDDMIESKHKKNINKKNQQVKREIESVLPSWRQANTIDTRKRKPDKNLPKPLDIDAINSRTNRFHDGGSTNVSDDESSSSERSTTSHPDRDDRTSEPAPSAPNTSATGSKSSSGNRTETSDGRDRTNSSRGNVECLKPTDKPVEQPARKRSWGKLPSPRIGRKSAKQLSIPSDSSSSPSASPSPTRRNIPIIVRPSDDGDSNTNLKPDAQGSSRSSSQSSSPQRHRSEGSSDSPTTPSPSQPCPPEVEARRWSSQTSLADSNCSSTPRMSIVIAQEPSMTKINSRYFTVETCQQTEHGGDTIMEESEDCETMQIEGEFSFGREPNKFSKVQREALKSLRCLKVTRDKSELVKDEEVSLSQEEMTAELKALETLNYDLEKRGVQMENLLRSSMESERPLDNEDEILREWLTLIHEKNVILRRESELIYLMQFHQYEERYWAVECELRALVSMRDEVKSSDDLRRERELLAELLTLVQKRSFIVDSLEEDRIRERQEDESVKNVLEDGLNEPPAESWDQKPDYTKVAFSRFYC